VRKETERRKKEEALVVEAVVVVLRTMNEMPFVCRTDTGLDKRRSR